MAGPDRPSNGEDHFLKASACAGGAGVILFLLWAVLVSQANLIGTAVLSDPIVFGLVISAAQIGIFRQIMRRLPVEQATP